MKILACLMLLLVCFLSLENALTQAENKQENSWTQFRGPAANGYIDADLPIVWDQNQNIKWKVPMDGTGWSQPLVHEGKVYLFQVKGDALKKPKEMKNAVSDISTMIPLLNKPLKAELVWELLCYNLSDGQLQWRTELARQQPTVPIHVSNTYATETPVLANNKIMVYSGIFGKAIALDLSGKKLWETSLGTYTYESNFGPGSSPIHHDKNFIIQCDNEKKSFVVMLDETTGSETGRIERTHKTSWSTPYLWDVSGNKQLVICGKENVTAYDAKSSAVLWELNKVPSSFTATPIATKDMLFLGNNGPFSDGPLYGIHYSAAGDITLPANQKTSSSILWSRKKSGPGFASPIILDGQMYIAFDSRLYCYNIASGEEVYRQRLPAGRAQVACPITNGKHIYLIDESGTTFVIKPGKKFELVQVNKLDDLVWASPAATTNQLLIRGTEQLYCIEDQTTR